MHLRTVIAVMSAYPMIAKAGRYDPDPNAGGGEYLLWIPVLVAAVMYSKFEKFGYGRTSAVIGGAAGLAFIYYFPLLASLIIAAVFVLMLVGELLNW